MMGVNVEKTLMFSHIFTGGMAALAGITLVSRVGAAYPLAGEGKELDVIAACVIGGTALTGGKGHISGTFIGVLIMGNANRAESPSAPSGNRIGGHSVAGSFRSA